LVLVRRAGLIATLSVLVLLSFQPPQVHSVSISFPVFPQSPNLFTVTQTCSPQGQVTNTSLTITMGNCTPEFADVTASSERFYVDAVTWNAVYNGTNTAPTTSNPPNEMVGFLTDDIVNFNGHEVGIICKLDEGLFIGYYQDHTKGGEGFQTTGSLGSCMGGPTFTDHNFSVTMSYNGTTNTFVYRVDSNTWTLKYSSTTNYTRLLMWWWMTVHRNGSWNVPTGTLTQYNSISIDQDMLQSTGGAAPPRQESSSSSPSRSPSRSAMTPTVDSAVSVPLVIWGLSAALIPLPLVAWGFSRREKSTK